MKTVSVIIPVYNVERYIADTVQSVLNQTYSQVEVLIVDDESPDRSVEVCQQFNDPRINILHQQNRGLAGARNTGIRYATGDYIAFLDGDDLWLPEKLEKHVAHLEQCPQVGVSFSRSALIDETGTPTGTYLMPQLRDITAEDMLCACPIGNGSAAVLRRETLDAICFESDRNGTIEPSYFDEQFRRAEDLDCWLRILIQTNWQIEGLPEALTLYRVNTGGLSASFYKQLDAVEQVIAKTETYAPDVVAPVKRRGIASYAQIQARNAIRQRDGAAAVKLSHYAIATYWKILLEQPRRMVPTLIVAHLLKWLPASLHPQIEALVVRKVAAEQQNIVLQSQLSR
jgi:glycosyltransferase involved in cell wall biosynthesis